MLNTSDLILLIVFLVVGVLFLLCLVYCCACKPGCENLRRRRLAAGIARDEEAIAAERDIQRAELAERFETNEQNRNDIRAKYQLKKTRK